MLRDRNAADEPFGGSFNLVAMDGQPFTEKDLRATPSLVFFGFTHCPDVCPTTLYELDGYLKQLGPEAADIKAYFISVDPERDTQEIMKTYVSNVSDRIIGVTGTPANVAEVVKSYHIYAKRFRPKTVNIPWITRLPCFCSTKADASVALSLIKRTQIQRCKS